MPERYYPGFLFEGLPQVLRIQNREAYAQRHFLKESRDQLFLNEARIANEVAPKVIGKVLDLPENKDTGRQGLVLALAYRKFPILQPVAIRFGEINTPDPVYENKLFKYTDYARGKALFLIRHPDLIASKQNLELPEEKRWTLHGVKLPGGAIAFKNGVVLGISGLATGEKDTAVAFSIGIQAHLIRMQVAEKLARRFNCADDLTQILKVL